MIRPSAVVVVESGHIDLHPIQYAFPKNYMTIVWYGWMTVPEAEGPVDRLIYAASLLKFIKVR